MGFKILCSDLDGTLLSTKSDVSDFTITEVSRIKDHIRVILVSARMPQSMTYLQERLGILNQPLICYNGALVLDQKKEIFSEVIAIKAVQRLYELSEEHKIKLGLYFNREWYVEETTERVQKEIRNTNNHPVYQPTTSTLDNWSKRGVSAHKIMLMCTKSSADIIFPKLEKELQDFMHIYRSNDTLIEVAPKTVSKLSAIKSILRNNESLDDIIAFGDNYNDMEMLKHCGMGVAVENARVEVKEIADQTTLKNTEDGVAHFIKQYLI